MMNTKMRMTKIGALRQTRLTTDIAPPSFV
jgi:hypothetical protein